MNQTSGHMQNVSVIGLGAMGSGIARTLLEAGWCVSVWNRSRDKVDSLVSLGARGCDDPRSALAASEYTVVCVADYGVWNRIMEEHGLHDTLEGNCIIQLTGGEIDQVRAHGSFIESHGGRLADGAVMCFPRQLGTAEGSILVSGAPDVLDECDTILRALAPEWTNLGTDITRPAVLSRSLTSGFLISLLGFINGMAICRSAGISLDVYMEHVDKANAFLPEEKQRLMAAVRDGRTRETEASVATWAGGHQTIRSVAESLGTNLVLQDAVRMALEQGQEAGLGDADLSALIKVFECSQAP